MKYYKVKKGSHVFNSVSFPWFPRVKLYPCIDNKIFSVEFELTESAKYKMQLASGQYDKDQYDWNIKIAPHSFGFPFNKDAVMAAVRYNPITDLFELTCYSNNDYSFRFGTDDNQVMLTGGAGRYKWTATKLSDGVSWKMELSGFIDDGWVYSQTIHKMRKDFEFIVVAPDWFGGDNNSAGEYGGVSPQDIKLGVTLQSKEIINA